MVPGRFSWSLVGFHGFSWLQVGFSWFQVGSCEASDTTSASDDDCDEHEAVAGGQ